VEGVNGSMDTIRGIQIQVLIEDDPNQAMFLITTEIARFERANNVVLKP
jgi:hypothetical protein